MSNPSDKALQTVLGTNLQMGALRVVLVLGGFAFFGACFAWLVH